MRHSQMTRGGQKRRKRRRLLSESSEEDHVEEVADFDLVSTDSSSAPSLNDRLREGGDEGGGVPAEIYEDGTAWAQRYAGVESQAGLVVSSKKKKEVVEWLRKALDFSGPRLLMLGGPPGCGKSSVVQAACKELNCSIASWQAPFVGSRGVCLALLDDFRAFFVGSRYPTLQVADSDGEGEEKSRTTRRLLLVEELPLHVTDLEQNKEALRRIFSDAAQFAPHPTIVIMSDGDKGIARLARFLFGLDLLSSPMVRTIKIPAVTDAMMKRRLREVLAAERLSISSQKLDLVVSTSRGDMRAALNCLQLSSTVGSDNVLEARDVNSRKRQRSKRTRNVAPLAQINHDITLSTYHAVSKILNNKRGQTGASKYVAEEVLEEARTDPSAFLAFLHQNYLQFFGTADDVVPTLLCLSEADTLMPWIQERDLRTDLSDCAASIATRAFLHFNSSPIRSGWRPIRGPESREVARESRDLVQHAQERFSRVLRPGVFSRSTLCETVAYVEKIKQCTIKQWELSRNDRPVGTPSLANAADIAMVDLESTATERPAGLTGKHFSSRGPEVSRFPNTEDDTEDIEEWDD